MSEFDLSPQEEELEALRSIYDVCTFCFVWNKAESIRRTGKTYRRRKQHGISKERKDGGPFV
jgi:hypothetical protein